MNPTTLIEAPAPAHAPTAQEVRESVVSPEVIEDIRHTLTWMLDTLLARQFTYATNPPDFTPLLSIPTADQLPDLEDVQTALRTFLDSLPTDGTPLHLRTLQALHRKALESTSPTMGDISHCYWQILSWNKVFAVLNPSL